MFENQQEYREQLRNRIANIFHKYSLPRWIVFFIDTSAVFFMFLVAYLLRFNLNPADIEWHLAIIHGLITLFVYTICMLIFRSYAGLIRHTTLTDISLVFVATSASATLLMLFSVVVRSFKINPEFNIPISVISIHYVLLTSCEYW
jgi:FlaA1/EpsC-like NDP-sugar epimerase